MGPVSSENIYNKMIMDYNSLTKAEIKIADYVLKHKLASQYLSISELAKACRVGEATLTRFCRSLGCRGFHDFKLALAQAAAADTEDALNLYGEVHAADSISDKYQKLCRIGIKALRQTLTLMDVAKIGKAVDCLWAADVVYCFGQGNSSIVAMDAWGRFSSITTKFHHIADSHIQASTTALLGPRDVVLYFSFSGSTRALAELGELKRRCGVTFILVSRFPHSPGAAFADLTLVCGANESPLQQGSIAAKIAQLFIVDVLFNEYCARDPELTVLNRGKTMDAISPKLL